MFSIIPFNGRFMAISEDGYVITIALTREETERIAKQQLGI